MNTLPFTTGQPKFVSAASEGLCVPATITDDINASHVILRQPLRATGLADFQQLDRISMDTHTGIDL